MLELTIRADVVTAAADQRVALSIGFKLLPDQAKHPSDDVADDQFPRLSGTEPSADVFDAIDQTFHLRRQSKDGDDAE